MPLSIGLDLSLTGVAAGGTGPSPDVVSGDFEQFSRTWKPSFSGTLYGRPSNGFYFVNNVGGKGSLVNGVNFTSRLTAVQASFPLLARIDADFGNGGGSGIGAFAYGYPAIVYGSTPYGDADGPFNETGFWPRSVNATTSLKCAYDLTLGGNLDSYNILLDMYLTTAPGSSDGSFVLEVSFFPYCNPRLPFVGTDLFTFVSIGKCRVGKQGTQFCVYPVDAAGTSHRAILSGTVDMLELMLYAKAQGWITGNEYTRGAEFGPEVQVPSANNSAPYRASITFNTIPVWS